MLSVLSVDRSLGAVLACGHKVKAGGQMENMAAYTEAQLVELIEKAGKARRDAAIRELNARNV